MTKDQDMIPMETTMTKHPRRLRAAAAVLACCWLAPGGCSSPPPADPGREKVTEDTRKALDTLAVNDLFEEQARRGVLRERAIRDMNFEPASARLTVRGTRNLEILAGALRKDGGTIAVQRGSADAALYAARVAEVRRQLVAMGIREDRFALKNGAAGGPGVATAEALEIQADMKGTPLPSATGQVLDPRAGTTGAMNGGTP